MEVTGDLTRAVLAEAERLGFSHSGVCGARPPETLTIYRNWIAKGAQGTMDYLSRSVSLRSDPATLLPGVQSIIAVGLNYRQSNPAVPGKPRIAMYALGRDYHKTIRGKLRRLKVFLEGQCPDEEFRICVDSAPILEREYAQRAGLGWFGKNTCLIDSRQGSFFLIGFLLTTARLATSKPAEGGCGTCRICIDACPTGAIVFEEERWQVDARSCVSYLTIEHKGPIPGDLQTGIGDWTFGCDVCQDVCPFNTPRSSQPLRGQPTVEPDFLATRDWPDLERLAVIQEQEWDELTRGSALRRAGLEGLRRNAKINLQNAQVPSQGAQRRKLDLNG